MEIKKFYKMEDWQRDGSLKVRLGQIIEPSIYWHLLECVPPKANGTIFQCGEPYSHNWKTGEALYMTFEHVGDDYYKYVGLKA